MRHHLLKVFVNQALELDVFRIAFGLILYFTHFGHNLGAMATSICSCWTSQNITEQVSVRVRPCVQRVPGPMQLVVLSEVKCFTAKQPS